MAVLRGSIPITTGDRKMRLTLASYGTRRTSTDNWMFTQRGPRPKR